MVLVTNSSKYFSPYHVMLLADLILCLAQFFPVADRVVILEDGKIKAQGSWEAIKHKASSSISKFSIQHQLNRGVPPLTSGRLNAQLQAKEEAQAELARKPGDLELYFSALREIGRDTAKP